MSEQTERTRVDAVARSWLGTPYHHHAQIKGVGTDCAHLLIGTYAEAGLIENFDPGYYAPQFFLHSKEERFLGWVQKFSREIPGSEAKVGDIVIYKLGLVYAHGGIIVAPGWPHAIIHAHRASRRVCLSGGLSAELGRPARHPRFFTRWR